MDFKSHLVKKTKRSQKYLQLMLTWDAEYNFLPLANLAFASPVLHMHSLWHETQIVLGFHQTALT